jgi:hypothetical protein
MVMTADNIGNKLRVRHRLVGTAHNAEADVDLAALQKRRNDVSLIQSNYDYFGSGIAVDGMGWRMRQGRSAEKKLIREKCSRKHMATEYERRRSGRLVVTVPVRITGPAQGNITGETRDLSLSGVYFYIDSELWIPGESIRVRLPLPIEVTHSEPLTVWCFGHIVRVEKLAGSMSGLAVHFDSFARARQ